MIDMRTYAQQELCAIFNTNRNDEIKKKLTKLGYTFTTEGRGKNIKITITGYQEPPLAEFKEFCINEFGFDVRVDFNKLYTFFNTFFFDENFRKLPYIEMTRRIEKEMKISRQTISKWIKHLAKENVLGLGDFTYYAHGYDENGNKQTVPITEKLYKDGWCEYWTGKETSYYKAISALVAFVCGFPQKVPEKVFNAFEHEKIERMIKIIEKEREKNG